MSTLTADEHVHEDCGHDTEEFQYDGPPVIVKEDFTSLHVHTEHSFLDGIPKISQLIERVTELNQAAVAVTDHGEVSGHLRLQKEADKAGIKPIFGIESYFCDDRTEKKGKKGELYHHLTVLAKSNRGLHNLWALASQAFIDGQHYADPRCDWELLRRYQQDMIVTGGCIGGAVSAFYNDEGRDYNEDIGAARISQMLDIFGPNFYLEIHTFNDPLHHKLNAKLMEVANDFSIPCIAVSDSHYLRPEDWEDHELLTAIQMRKAQPLHAQILTPSGWTKMGSLSVGDRVIGPDGAARSVEGVFPRGEDEVYRVHFKDGTWAECTDDHLWSVSSYNRAPQVRRFEDIRRSALKPGKRANGRPGYRWSVPLVSAPVQYNPVSLPLDPYTLGALLGDGSFTESATPSLAVALGEEQILDEVLLPEGCEWGSVTQKEGGGSRSHAIVGSTSRSITAQLNSNPLTAILRELSLQGLVHHEKFVPDIYKLGSPEQRLALLQGLVDTDGEVTDRSVVRFTSVSERLAQDVVDIVRSLAGRARLSFRPSVRSADGARIATGRTAYTVVISLPPGMTPARLERKVAKCRERTHYRWAKAIVRIESMGRMPVQCIKVSGEDGLYVTDGFTVTHNTYDDPTRYQYGPNQLRLFGEREVRERLAYLPEAFVSECIANTKMIADQCDARIEGTRMMPVFFDSRETDSIKMRERIEEGFKRKIEAHKRPEKWPEYRERLEYEVSVIDPKEFPGYFHTVGDIMRTAKENDILTGPGRGSAAGCLLAYLMDITEIDPIPAGLIFERFLDPERNSLPDIDLDFPQLERHTVRGLIEDKYGKLNVATIGALNTLAAKTLMRDLCRGLKISQTDCNEMIRIINDVPDLEVAHIDTSWPIIMNEVGHRFRERRVGRDGEDLPSFLEMYPRLFDLMEKFLDHIRHSAAHAAGVVISKEPLLGRLPLRMKNDDIRTQFDFKDVEELGFVKIDILGLRTLSTLMRARKLILERHPDCGLADFHDWQYEWDKYYEDQDVLRGLWEGKNIGIFQLESAGLRQTAKRFKPTSLEDVCALISVYRPGITRTFDEETGLNLLDLYIERRDGLREASYKHPKQEAILGVTNGNFLYQEQIMFTCAELAGYSLAETDRVRKILGKKLVDKMVLERQIFVKGCIENGIDERTAESIFDDMENFGKYGFNKSHGYAYAMVAMWCAWIKHYYPREFMTALFMTNEEDAPMYSRECQRLGIPLLPPDINESKSDFSITPGGVIRYGLSKIKYMAKGAAVLEEFQPFSSIEDLVDRVPKSRVNKKALTAAILCGAMDSLITDEDKANYPEWYTVQQIALHKFYTARKEKIAKSFDALCDECDLASQTVITDEHSNFDHLCSEFQILDRTYCEKEYLGSVLSHDPIGPFRAIIRQEHNYIGEDHLVASEKCKIGGTIGKVRPLVTKKGKNPGSEMCQMWIDLPLHVVGDDDGVDEDGEEQVQLVVFPDAYARYKDVIEAGAPVLAYAEKMKNDGGLSLYRMIRLDHLLGDDK